MRPIECFKTYDGQLFESEEKALAHADDILGEELDRLLRVANHDMSRSEEYKFIVSLMKNRAALRNAVFKLADILKYELNGE